MKILLIFLAIALLFSSCEDYMNINTTIREIQKLAKKNINFHQLVLGLQLRELLKTLA